MRCRHRLSSLCQHFTTRAVAGVSEILGNEPLDCRLIQLQALRLPHNIAVVGEPHRREITHRRCLVFRPTRHLIHVFNAKKEARASRASRQPSDECRSKISEMKRGRWARGEPSVRHRDQSLRDVSGFPTTALHRRVRACCPCRKRRLVRDGHPCARCRWSWESSLRATPDGRYAGRS